MKTAELKALADQCICHPASRGIEDIEAAGEGLKHLISQLEDAQGEIRALMTTEARLRERVEELEEWKLGLRMLPRANTDQPTQPKCWCQTCRPTDKTLDPCGSDSSTELGVR